jgi:hypothetical protein
MSKSLFISCVYEDSHFIDNIIKWAEKNKLGDVTITSETEDKRLQGVAEIKKHIQSKIQGAAVIIVLIGRDTHNHDWIRAESELANSYHKSILCLRVPETSSPAPEILKKYKLVNFDPDSLKKELDLI